MGRLYSHATASRRLILTKKPLTTTRVGLVGVGREAPVHSFLGVIGTSGIYSNGKVRQRRNRLLAATVRRQPEAREPIVLRQVEAIDLQHVNGSLPFKHRQ